mgnify:CR=1 FL=1
MLRAEERADVEALIDVYAPPQTAASVAENPGVLAEAEVIMSGWGMAKMDEAFLAAAPKLQFVFYGAGSIRGFATDAAWERGVRITSAYAANAIPTAEFALAQILISLKRGWYFVRALQREGRYPERTPVPGAYGSKVGLISLGMIGSYVTELLQAFDIEVLAYTSSEEKAARLGARRARGRGGGQSGQGLGDGRDALRRPGRREQRLAVGRPGFYDQRLRPGANGQGHRQRDRAVSRRRGRAGPASGRRG